MHSVLRGRVTNNASPQQSPWGPIHCLETVLGTRVSSVCVRAGLFTECGVLHRVVWDQLQGIQGQGKEGTKRGFHVGDARLGGVRIFDTRVKIQHDAQWSVLTQASIF